MKQRRRVPISVPLKVIRGHVERTRAMYLRYAVGFGIAGLVGVGLAMPSYRSDSPVPIAAGTIGGILLVVALWAVMQWRQLREDGPLLRLLADPKRIVWHFVHVWVTRAYGGLVERSQHDVVVADEDGETFSFWVPDEAVENVRKALSGLAPHATSGYSDATARAYQKEPLNLRLHEPLLDPDEDEHEGEEQAGGEGRGGGVAMGDDGSPYRGTSRRANPVHEASAREARRAALRSRRRRRAALFLASPVAVVAAWVAAAQLEVKARERWDEQRTVFVKGAAGVAAIHREAQATEGIAEPPPVGAACQRRLADESFVEIWTPEQNPDGSPAVGFHESYWTERSRTFAGPVSKSANASTMEVLTTAPWNWRVLARKKPALFIYTRVLREAPAGPILLVRLVERDSGKLVCQGTIAATTAGAYNRCTYMTLPSESERPRCEVMFRRNSTITNAVQQAIEEMR